MLLPGYIKGLMPMKQVYSATQFLLIGLIAGVCIGCDDTVGSGTIDDIEIGRLLRLDLENIIEIRPVSEDQIQRAIAVFNEPPANLDSLRFFTANAEIDEGVLMDLRIALLPEPAQIEGATLAAAVGSDGVLYRFRIWGIDDPESAWENYWRQYQYPTIRTVLDPATVFSDSLVDEWWAELQEDSTAEARLLGALYRQQFLMRNNSYLIRHTMAMTGVDDVPDPEFYRRSMDDFAELNQIADVLRPLLGENAYQKYKAATNDAPALFEPLLAHTQAGNSGKLRDAIMDFRRPTCSACHNIEDHDLGGGGRLNRALYSRLTGLGIRPDIYRVGYDIWPVPGEESKSQELANLVKAMMILMGS